jgi:hypothetical protein
MGSFSRSRSQGVEGALDAAAAAVEDTGDGRWPGESAGRGTARFSAVVMPDGVRRTSAPT